MNCKTHVDIKDAKIILPRIDKIWYYSHFTDEETEAERLGNLCKVTSLVNRGAMIQLQVVWLQIVHIILELCPLSVPMALGRE